MKIFFGGHYRGVEIPEFVRDQEYELSAERIEILSDKYDLMIRKIDVPPSERKEGEPIQYKKYLFLDKIGYRFTQR